MPNREMVSDVKFATAIVPAVATATVTSAEIDLQGFDSATVLFDIGNSGDTLSGSVYWTLTLTESDTSGGTFTTVAAADIVGGVASHLIDAPAEDSVVVAFGYTGSKRYIKGVATKTGTHSNGTPIGIASALGHASNAPVANTTLTAS